MVKNIVVADMSKEWRGGSLYAKRLHEILGTMRGINTTFVKKTDESGEFFLDVLRLVCQSWIRDKVAIGTAPEALALAAVCRKSVLMIQSPISEWSWVSRLVFVIVNRLRGPEYICVSQTTQGCLEKGARRKSIVVYADIPDVGYRPPRTQNQREAGIAMAIMNRGYIDKGFLASAGLVSHMSRKAKVVVDIYGSMSIDWRTVGSNVYGVRKAGFCKNPWENFWEFRNSMKMVYLGISSYEGLHMAVVEAACLGIPTLMSDIKAHRELEEIAECDLLIGGCQRDYELLLDRLVFEDGLYDKMSISSRQLYERFSELSGRSLLALRDLEGCREGQIR